MDIITSRLFLICSAAEKLHIGEGIQSCCQILPLELIATNVLAIIAAKSSQSDVETALACQKSTIRKLMSLSMHDISPPIFCK
jgi:hypothetical protein